MVEEEPLGEKYVEKVVDLTRKFINKVNKYEKLTDESKFVADTFYKELQEISDNFIERLKIDNDSIKVTRECTEDIHNQIAAYLQDGEQSPMFYQSVPVSKLLETLNQTIEDALDDDPAVEYVPLVKRTLNEAIRKRRPDIYKKLNPNQTELQDQHFCRKEW